MIELKSVYPELVISRISIGKTLYINNVSFFLILVFICFESSGENSIGQDGLERCLCGPMPPGDQNVKKF
jgi:hypothetical protein